MVQPIRLTRDELPGAITRVLNRGRAWNPDVYLAEVAGRSVVVKDFAPRGRLPRLLAPLTLWWEIRALRALAEHGRVPGYLGRVDRLAFVQEYVACRPISGRVARSLPIEFADAFDAAVRRMHELGVVHLDLRHRSNVTVGDDGAPVLIDFGSAIALRPGRLAARCLLPLLARIDLAAGEKLRTRQTRGRPDPARATASS
jgi:serine/threonine protein kinase